MYKFEAEVREGLHRGKVLCVENIDRLSRQGVKAAATLIWQLNEGGVDVATWQDKHIYRAKAGNDLLDIVQIAVIAKRGQEESETKRDRGRDAWERRYKGIETKTPGTRSGRPPAWLVWDGEVYQRHPHRAEVLEEIFDLYLSGVGTYKIVQMLNERQEPSWPNKATDSKKGWYLAYVGNLIRNRAVLGEYVTLKGEVISTDYYPKVIGLAAFTRANEIMSGRNVRSGRNSRRFNNLLSGLPRCSACEGTAAYENKGENSFSRHTRKSGEQVMYARKTYERLRCDNNRRHHGCENKELFDYRVVEKAVLTQLLEIAVSDTEDTRPATIRMIDEKIMQATREIEVETLRARNIVRQMGDGSSRFVRQELDEIEAKIGRLETELQFLQSERTTEAHKPTLADDTKLIAEAMAALRHEDLDIRYAARSKINMALRRIIHDILISPDGTFTVLSHIAVWQFNKQGTVIGGQAI